ncbi:hypothetical protein, partial [Phenylobacterium sp.]|uniref:hypothetical protein n=1 Tax=Phenylobacterium sp. TaxID=1871053 RepID=UPI0025D37DE6
DRATVEAMSQLNRAAMQGLSILLMFSNDPKSIQPGLDLLHWYKDVLTDRLIAEAAGTKPRGAAPTKDRERSPKDEGA